GIVTTTESAPASLYRVTVLGTALLRMWRGWKILIPVIVINALLQALLLWPGVLPYLSIAFIVIALLSLLILVKAYNFVAAAMLQAAVGPVDWREVYANLWRRYWLLLAWSVALLIVVIIAFALYVVPGFIVLALTPYLLLGVVDGQRNPLAVNFRTIGARWGRWLITVIIMGVLCFVLWFLSALNGFFVTGAPAAFIGWLVLGFVASWFTCAWALVYRSVNAR
ncbi:MAG: hypothetical protein ACR2KE_11145, partial [Candidatus Nanopelagicales bacterium]